MICERCEPCRISTYKSMQQCNPPRTHYFYTEKCLDSVGQQKSSSVGNVKSSSRSITSQSRPSSLDSPRKTSTKKSTSDTNGSLKKKTRHRPSSAENKKSDKKKAMGTSSETKIHKKSASGKHKNKNLSGSKPECVEDLKKDLDTIKEQLYALTANRQEAVEVTNELEIRYKNLKKINESQEREINCLKQQNQQLAHQINNLSSSKKSTSSNNMSEAKKSLDQYNEKLSELYSEFMDAASAIGKSKEQVCKCIQKKHEEFNRLEMARKEQNQEIECKDEKLAKIMQSYAKLKDCQKNFIVENKQLTMMVEKLQNNLNKSVDESEKLRNEAACMKFQTEKLEEQIKCYCEQLDEKSRQVDNLSGSIRDLEENACETSQNAADYQNLNMQYQQLLFKYKSLLARHKMNEENEKSRVKELESVKQNECCLCDEICRMKRYAEDLCKMVDEGKITIARLKTLSQEKDTVIQCQLTEIDFKNKEIERLTRHVERLKQDICNIEANNSTNRDVGVCEDKKRNVVFASDHCCISLTDELQDLINALYEEIDKTMTKDEEIQRQRKNICCLECALNAKEKELGCLKNEVKVMQDQLKNTVQEKESLIKSLKRLEQQLCSTDYDEDYECKYYEEY